MHAPKLLILPLALVASAVSAADPAPKPLQAEQRLSEEEIRAILDKAAANPVHPTVPVALDDAAPLDPRKPPRTVHGEMGVGIGTNGYRSAYGTAAVPLGENGLAVISIDSESVGFYRGRR